MVVQILTAYLNELTSKSDKVERLDVYSFSVRAALYRCRLASCVVSV